MKPCANHQEALSWLAIKALDRRQEAELRAHLEQCPGCRNYFEEMTSVVGKLSAPPAEPIETRATESFHRKLVQRIEAETRPGIWIEVWVWLRGVGLDWRTAATVGGAALTMVALFFVMLPQRKSQPIARVVSPVFVITKPAREVEQTFGSYRMLANRSLDLLDQELTTEAKTSPSGAPAYTVASLARVMAAD